MRSHHAIRTFFDSMYAVAGTITADRSSSTTNVSSVSVSLMHVIVPDEADSQHTHRLSAAGAHQTDFRHSCAAVPAGLLALSKGQACAYAYERT
jgi:hypothetical protein